MGRAQRDHVPVEEHEDPNELPLCYGLMLWSDPGKLKRLVPFVGQGMTQSSISSWLSVQDSIRLTRRLDSWKWKFDGDEAARYAMTEGKTMVLVLIDSHDPQQKHQGLAEVALAARSVPVRVPIRTGNESVAKALGVPAYPCVLVVHSSNGFLSTAPGMSAHVRWPIWHPKWVGTQHSWAGVRLFLSERALPPLVPYGEMGESNRFSAQLRRKRHECTVYLFHNVQGRWMGNYMDEDAQHQAAERSKKAMAVVEETATRFSNVATFVSADFFDNSPDLAMDYKVDENMLPVVVVVHARFGQGPSTSSSSSSSDRLPPAMLDWRRGLLNEDEAGRFIADAILVRGAKMQNADPAFGMTFTPVARGEEVQKPPVGREERALRNEQQQQQEEEAEKEMDDAQEAEAAKEEAKDEL